MRVKKKTLDEEEKEYFVVPDTTNREFRKLWEDADGCNKGEFRIFAMKYDKGGEIEFVISSVLNMKRQ